MLSRRRERLADALRSACELDVLALKPGNVSVFAAGHGMRAEDFLASASAIVEPLCAPQARVGERILGAVQATRRAVGCNTNLGIVLLAAPLMQAALHARAGEPLRAALERVLAGLDQEDARRAYQAIRLDAPGGLGASARHDVRAPPEVDLRTAMRAAARRDAIARQYADGYAEVFALGVARARAGRERAEDPAWTASAVYLAFLAALPDTHVQRKHGAAAARRLAREAAPWRDALERAEHPEQLRADLLAWDGALKARGINPGTSADLTVASLFAARAGALLEDEITRKEPEPGSRGNTRWDPQAHIFCNPHS